MTPIMVWWVFPALITFVINILILGMMEGDLTNMDSSDVSLLLVATSAYPVSCLVWIVLGFGYIIDGFTYRQHKKGMIEKKKLWKIKEQQDLEKEYKNLDDAWYSRMGIYQDK